MTTVTQDAVRFNPYVPGYFDDPYPHYARLRASAPIHRSFMGSWILTRYADCEAVLQHPGFSSDQRHWPGFAMRYRDKELVATLLSRNLLNTDPPAHTDLRRYLNTAFMPASLDALKAKIHEIVEEKLDRLAGRDRFDLISEYALAVPLATISYIFDIPPEDIEQAKTWSIQVSSLIEPLPDLDTLRDADRGISDFTGYLERKILDPTTSRESFLHRVMNAPLRTLVELDAYLLPNLVMFYAAGHETTVNLIGNGIHALLQNPQQRHRMAADELHGETAVDELLRYDSSQQLAWRVATEDVEIAGHRFHSGEQVMLLLGAANRDPAAFPDPDVLDLGRAPNRHLSFGRGRHTCMGAWLAKLQGGIAIREFCRRFPAATCDLEGTSWLHKLSFRGLRRFTIIPHAQPMSARSA
jgi:pimeloyl-[acyl-carrier protein] synthase